MGRKGKERFSEVWAGIIILAVIIYAIITIIFWLIVVGIACLLVFLAYILTTEAEWFENRLGATISVYLLTFTLIGFGSSEIYNGLAFWDKK